MSARKKKRIILTLVSILILAGSMYFFTTSGKVKEIYFSSIRSGNVTLFNTLILMPGFAKAVDKDLDASLLYPIAHEETALHLAVRYGRAGMVRKLISRGARVDAHNRWSLTPLHIAAWYGKEEIAAILIDNGADINARVLWPPLDYPISPDVGDTPLHLSVQGKNPGVLRVLVAKRADINAKNKSGVTPLHQAVSLGDIDLISTLLSCGADKRVRDNEGRTPLDMALQRGCSGVLTLLSGNVPDGLPDRPEKISAGPEALFVVGSDNHIYSVEIRNKRIRWSSKQSASDMIVAPPVIYGVIEKSGALYALDSETGREKWCHKAESPQGLPCTFSNPVVKQGLICFVEEAGGKQNICIINSDSGRIVKKLEYYISGIYPGAYAFDDGVIYVRMSKKAFCAIEIDTGNLIWKNESQSRGHLALVKDGNIVYFANNSEIFAIESKTGRVKWRYESLTQEKMKSNEEMDHKSLQVCISEFGIHDEILWTIESVRGPSTTGFRTGVVLDAQTGAKKAEFTINFAYAVIFVADGTAYFDDQFDSCFFVAVDLGTGKEKWKRKTGDSVPKTLAARKGIVIAGSRGDGYSELQALSEESGKEIWRLKIEGYDINRKGNFSLSTEGTAYFGCDDGTILGIDLQTGSEIWKFSLPNKDAKR